MTASVTAMLRLLGNAPAVFPMPANRPRKVAHPRTGPTALDRWVDLLREDHGNEIDRMSHKEIAQALGVSVHYAGHISRAAKGPFVPAVKRITADLGSLPCLTAQTIADYYGITQKRARNIMLRMVQAGEATVEYRKQLPALYTITKEASDAA